MSRNDELINFVP